MKKISPERKHFILVIASALAILGLLIAGSLWLAPNVKNEQSQSEPNPLQAPRTALPMSTMIPLERKRFFLITGFVVLALVLVSSFWLTLNIFGKHSSGQMQSTNKVTVLPANANFERGIIYPRWQPTAYGPADTIWQDGVKTMRTQTAARWLEIPILFAQQTSQSTQVGLSQSTPDVQSFISGVRLAHAQGYSVFFVPLMSVHEAGGWSGTITLSTPDTQKAWFASYWQTLKPYIEAAQTNGVEQMAVGTELQTIQKQVPASYWNQLITQIRTVFQQKLTYDMNWSSLSDPVPAWFKNTDLAMIGVSSYIPLTDTPAQVDAKQIPQLWQQKILSKLDSLSVQIAKPVLISEIGYRNTSDALYHTWLAKSSAPTSTTVQADAFDATLSNTYADPHIGGTFFWGWDDVGMFMIKDRPAAQILHKWYSLP